MNQVLKADIDRLTTHFAPDAELAGKTLLITCLLYTSDAADEL